MSDYLIKKYPFPHLLKAHLVIGPTHPKTNPGFVVSNFSLVWKSWMALCVSGPWIPSSTNLNPFPFNFFWMAKVSAQTKAALVWQPTTPSTTRCEAFWKSITAASVLWPNWPSTTSCGLAPKKFNLSWMVWTHLPFKAALVLSPTIPSTTNNESVWNCLTATLVNGPKIPSSTNLYPNSFNLFWIFLVSAWTKAANVCSPETPSTTSF